MQQRLTGASVIVALPAEIDLTNADQVYDCLAEAAESGARVVIADCTATTFCDAAGARRLVMAHARAAGLGVQLRLVIPPGGLLRRVLELVGADSVLPVYSCADEAGVLLVPPAQDPLSAPRSGHAEGAP